MHNLCNKDLSEKGIDNIPFNWLYENVFHKIGLSIKYHTWTHAKHVTSIVYSQNKSIAKN